MGKAIVLVTLLPGGDFGVVHCSKFQLARIYPIAFIMAHFSGNRDIARIVSVTYDVVCFQVLDFQLYFQISVIIMSEKKSTKRKLAKSETEAKAKKAKKTKFAWPDLPAINSLQGYVFATTGRLPAPRDELIAWIEKHGGTYTATLTKKVNYVIAIDPQLVSDKMDKAKKNGVELVSLDWLIERCKSPPLPLPPKPVEETKKSKTKKKKEAVQQVKQPGLKLLLAHNYEPEGKTDVQFWWMSEKLDGVRALWNGKELLSRQGNQFFAPQFILDELPKDMVLDGELYGGRGQFQTTVGIVKRHNATEEWKTLKYMVFDAPELNEPFEARMNALSARCDGLKYVEVVKQEECRGKDHVAQELKRVEEQGGEGLMLRKRDSMYERKRSKTLLKVKSFIDDEATVIGYEPGKGKHKGKMGSLLCRWNDIEFSVGSGFNDEQRAHPPAIDSKITFKYQETTKDGVPRFPVFVRVRAD